MNKIARMRNKCDELWRGIVLTNSHCESCWQMSVQAHHFVPKSLSAALRYDLKNGVAVCLSCHFAHHSKGDPAIHATIIKQRGQKWFNYIEMNRRKLVKVNLGYYQEIYDKLSKKTAK